MKANKLIVINKKAVKNEFQILLLFGNNIYNCYLQFRQRHFFFRKQQGSYH